MTKIRWGRYRKAFVAFGTAVCTTIEIYYMGETWAAPALTFVGAILVYATPNESSGPEALATTDNEVPSPTKGKSNG